MAGDCGPPGETMYTFLYVVYVILSSAVFLLFFFWALKHGQFRDQQRARFLPLTEERGEKEPMKRAGSNRSWNTVFLGLLFSGTAAIVAVVAYAVLHRG